LDVPVTHPLLERIASPDPEQRRAACSEAAEDPSAILLLDALGEALGDSDRSVAKAASESLVKIGKHAREVDVVLRRSLHSDAPQRRWQAAFTWARLEPPGERLLPALVEALDAHAGDVRWTAARLLVDSGRVDARVLPLLVGLLRSDARPRVRQMASHCLRELAPDRPEAADVLLAASREPDPKLRRASLMALASLPDPPAQVVDRWIAALDGEDDAAGRRIAASALADANVHSADAVAALERARERADDPDLQRVASLALERLSAQKSSASSE
jgi:hypothetical protein